jgi:hypothetical protein
MITTEKKDIISLILKEFDKEENWKSLLRFLKRNTISYLKCGNKLLLSVLNSDIYYDISENEFTTGPFPNGTFKVVSTQQLQESKKWEDFILQQSPSNIEDTWNNNDFFGILKCLFLENSKDYYSNFPHLNIKDIAEGNIPLQGFSLAVSDYTFITARQVVELLTDISKTPKSSDNLEDLCIFYNNLFENIVHSYLSSVYQINKVIPYILDDIILFESWGVNVFSKLKVNMIEKFSKTEQQMNNSEKYIEKVVAVLDKELYHYINNDIRNDSDFIFKVNYFIKNNKYTDITVNKTRIFKEIDKEAFK